MVKERVPALVIIELALQVGRHWLCFVVSLLFGLCFGFRADSLRRAQVAEPIRGLIPGAANGGHVAVEPHERLLILDECSGESFAGIRVQAGVEDAVFDALHPGEPPLRLRHFIDEEPLGGRGGTVLSEEAGKESSVLVWVLVLEESKAVGVVFVVNRGQYSHGDFELTSEGGKIRGAPVCRFGCKWRLV
jgi:hypothetical protein